MMSKSTDLDEILQQVQEQEESLELARKNRVPRDITLQEFEQYHKKRGFVNYCKAVVAPTGRIWIGNDTPLMDGIAATMAGLTLDEYYNQLDPMFYGDTDAYSMYMNGLLNINYDAQVTTRELSEDQLTILNKLVQMGMIEDNLLIKPIKPDCKKYMDNQLEKTYV